MIVERIPLLEKCHPPPSLFQSDKIKLHFYCSVMYQLVRFVLHAVAANLQSLPQSPHQNILRSLLYRGERYGAIKWTAKLVLCLLNWQS